MKSANLAVLVNEVKKVLGGGAVQVRESTRARNVGYEAADNLRQFCDGSVQDAATYK
jgi:hypothetical protein